MVIWTTIMYMSLQNLKMNMRWFCNKLSGVTFHWKVLQND